MTRALRAFDGRFGRLQLFELAGEEPPPCSGPRIAFKLAGPDFEHEVAGRRVSLTREGLLLLGPAETGQPLPPAGRVPAQLLSFQVSEKWLGERFPAAFGAGRRSFPTLHETVTPRIRQLADTLAVEMLHDRFLSHERLEFDLQELVLSIVEAYLAGRGAGARVWRGSPFADSRIRRALSLLRARPNKELNMDELASQVGLSRSRFYDLFQTSTGRSPRAYLDMLCVESAIAKLASGSAKIGEVSAELGFSAQSNFTRFFQHQVGIPPSEYRAALRRPSERESGD